MQCIVMYATDMY